MSDPLNLLYLCSKSLVCFSVGDGVFDISFEAKLAHVILCKVLLTFLGNNLSSNRHGVYFTALSDIVLGTDSLNSTCDLFYLQFVFVLDESVDLGVQGVP